MSSKRLDKLHPILLSPDRTCAAQNRRAAWREVQPLCGYECFCSALSRSEYVVKLHTLGRLLQTHGSPDRSPCNKRDVVVGHRRHSFRVNGAVAWKSGRELTARLPERRRMPCIVLPKNAALFRKRNSIFDQRPSCDLKTFEFQWKAGSHYYSISIEYRHRAAEQGAENLAQLVGQMTTYIIPLDSGHYMHDAPDEQQTQ